MWEIVVIQIYIIDQEPTCNDNIVIGQWRYYFIIVIQHINESVMNVITC